MKKLGEKKTVICCDYNDVEDIIREEYDMLDYSLVASEECGNDQSLTFSVKKGSNDAYDKEEIADKNWLYNTSLYLNDLADKDIIEEGEYLVRICW